DVRTTGFHANSANDTYRGIPHVLVLFITQRLRWRDRNAIARVHTHGINVFDRADNHDVVGQIAHDFQFVLFPPQHGFLDEHLAPWTRRQTPGDMLLKLLDRAGDIAPRPPEGEGGANDQWQAKLGEHLRGFVS